MYTISTLLLFLIHKYRLGLLENLATWRDNFPKNMKATTFYGECYPLLKMWNFRRRAEGFCRAHPLPAVKWWCFYESDEYFNFSGNYMSLNETKHTSAKLKYAGAMKDVTSTAKQVACVFLCCFVWTSCIHQRGVDILNFCICSCISCLHLSVSCGVTPVDNWSMNKK